MQYRKILEFHLINCYNLPIMWKAYNVEQGRSNGLHTIHLVPTQQEIVVKGHINHLDLYRNGLPSQTDFKGRKDAVWPKYLPSKAVNIVADLDSSGE